MSEKYENLYGEILHEFDSEIINCAKLLEHLIKHFEIAEKLMIKSHCKNYIDALGEACYYSPAREIIALLTPSSINGGSYSECWMDSTPDHVKEMDNRLLAAYIKDKAIETP